MKANAKFKLFISAFLSCLFILIQTEAQDIFSAIEKKFEQYKEASPKERVQIITDRDVYAPGDLIWFNSTIYNIFSPSVSVLSEEVKIYLSNHKSMELFNKTFTLEDGYVNGFVEIPSAFTEGVYYLQGETANSDDNNYYYKKIVIRKHAVPPFIIETNFSDKCFFPEDEIPLTIDFKDYYNEPLRSVNYKVNLFDGDKMVWESVGKIKKTGKVTMNIKVPVKLNTGLLTYKISADNKGVESRLDGKFSVLSDKIFIDFYPENGKLINGLKAEVNFYAYDVGGEPLAIEADLFEDNQKISTVNCNSSGIGRFNFLPKKDYSYHVQINKPLLVDKKYVLPTVVAKGIALQVLNKTSFELQFAISNGYENSRLIYLLGVSDGEIFWTSKHEIEKSLQVDVDLSPARGRLMHFIVLNAAYQIEGEQIVLKNKKVAKTLFSEVDGVDASKYSLMEVNISSPPKVEGQLLVTAVNSPWIVNDLADYKIQCIELPYDLGQQIIFQSSNFLLSDFSNQTLEVFSKYYVPLKFGWGKILKTNGAFNYTEHNLTVIENRRLNDQLTVRCTVEKRDGNIYHSNSNADSYFMTSNPRYISKLYQVKIERIPPYKAMLENGNSLKDVIQTMKAYSLQGNSIVFMGSANSLNFQGGALIVVDGISRGTNASLLDNISSYDVEEIFVSTNPSDIQRYTGFNSVGLIEITLKKGDLATIESQVAPNENAKFEAPEYKKRRGENVDDCRTTLFWAPDIEIDDEGKSKVAFYNAGLISNVNGKIYYIPKEGHPSILEFNYIIK